ncbi:MAG TPA: DUF6766 family protein [Ktedonobacterales bacterium]|nr:DUF6766 family protein [Ktedonobacterales bacterium]
MAPQTQHARDKASASDAQPSPAGAESRLAAPLRFLYNHEISTAMLLLFGLSLLAQSVTGFRTQAVGASYSFVHYLQYLVSSDFLETVAENWEGEFLPLAAYVFFTSWLHERGAKESRKPTPSSHDKTDDAPPARNERHRKDAPWPLKIEGHVGAVVRFIYLHSILFAFLLIFVLAVTLHATMGLGAYNMSLRAQHHHPVSIVGYMTSATFWLQSTRNWEAGFFSTAMLAVFSIFLREQGSPVSKVPDQPDKATAEEDESR